MEEVKDEDHRVMIVLKIPERYLITVTVQLNVNQLQRNWAQVPLYIKRKEFGFMKSDVKGHIIINY